MSTHRAYYDAANCAVYDAPRNCPCSVCSGAEAWGVSDCRLSSTFADVDLDVDDLIAHLTTSEGKSAGKWMTERALVDRWGARFVRLLALEQHEAIAASKAEEGRRLHDIDSDDWACACGESGEDACLDGECLCLSCYERAQADQREAAQLAEDRRAYAADQRRKAALEERDEERAA